MDAENKWAVSVKAKALTKVVFLLFAIVVIPFQLMWLVELVTNEPINYAYLFLGFGLALFNGSCIRAMKRFQEIKTQQIMFFELKMQKQIKAFVDYKFKRFYGVCSAPELRQKYLALSKAVKQSNQMTPLEKLEQLSSLELEYLRELLGAKDIDTVLDKGNDLADELFQQLVASPGQDSAMKVIALNKALDYFKGELALI